MNRLRRPLTPGKPGRHGTLYRYRISYSVGDPGCLPMSWHCWAYDAQHAQDKWAEGNEGDYEQLTDPVRV